MLSRIRYRVIRQLQDPTRNRVRRDHLPSGESSARFQQDEGAPVAVIARRGSPWIDPRDPSNRVWIGLGYRESTSLPLQADPDPVCRGDRDGLKRKGSTVAQLQSTMTTIDKLAPHKAIRVVVRADHK